jgi:hypothetical protein
MTQLRPGAIFGYEVVSNNITKRVQYSRLLVRNVTSETTLLCDCCLGGGRHAHLPTRPCSVCAGSGLISS